MEELLNYEGLVCSIIQRYTNYFDRDDLYQVGMIGLINIIILIVVRVQSFRLMLIIMYLEKLKNM